MRSRSLASVESLGAWSDRVVGYLGQEPLAKLQHHLVISHPTSTLVKRHTHFGGMEDRRPYSPALALFGRPSLAI